MSKIKDSVEKVLFAGVGLAATAIEKTGTLMNEMAEKGEASIGKSKATNVLLKHDAKPSDKEANSEAKELIDDEKLNRLTNEELNNLKEHIESIQNGRQD